MGELRGELAGGGRFREQPALPGRAGAVVEQRLQPTFDVLLVTRRPERRPYEFDELTEQIALIGLPAGEDVDARPVQSRRAAAVKAAPIRVPRARGGLVVAAQVATSPRTSAASSTASSTDRQTSAIRTSTVGYRGERRA